MNKRTFEVVAVNGIHARPATNLVNLAMEFESKVSLEVKGVTINLKSIMGLMSLGIYKGETIHLFAEGPDEKKAVEEISNYIKEAGLGKDI